MSSLPDSVLDVVAIDIVCPCRGESKRCKYDHGTKLCKTAIEHILTAVPEPSGQYGVWDREKVRRNLRQDLESLAPRDWGMGMVARLYDAIAAHDWYS